MSRTWKTAPWQVRKERAKHWFKQGCPEGINCRVCSEGSRGRRLAKYGKELDKDIKEESTKAVFRPLSSTNVFLENTEDWIYCHEESVCRGDFCTLHNRSDHKMRSFPQHWRADRGIMERICEHGVGHPDPDEFRVRNGEDDGIHGCDMCCR